MAVRGLQQKAHHLQVPFLRRILQRRDAVASVVLQGSLFQNSQSQYEYPIVCRYYMVYSIQDGIWYLEVSTIIASIPLSLLELTLKPFLSSPCQRPRAAEA